MSLRIGWQHERDTPTLGNGRVSLTVPVGIPQALELLSREVIRNQPENVAQFAADYFKYLLELRERTGIDPLTANSSSKVDTKFPPSKPHDKKTAVVAPLPQNPTSQPPIKQESFDLDLTDPELNNAAVKIQSSFRGFHARKDMQEGHGQNPKPGKQRQPDNQEFENLDLDDPELNRAATKIQSSFRGFHVRKDMADHHNILHQDRPEDVGPDESLDLADPELNDAAVKIQSSFRGFQARKNKQKSHSNKDSDDYDGHIYSEISKEKFGMEKESEDLGQLDQAATTIQSHYRGYKERKEFQQRTVDDRGSKESAPGT